MLQREITGQERPLLGRQRPARQVVISSNNPHKLEEVLRRERARRSIVVDSKVERIQPGLWAVRVTQLKPIRPRWVKPTAVAGAALAALVSLAALGSLLVDVVGGASIAGAGALVAVAAAMLIMARAKSGPGGGDVQVDVSVRVRR